ncbi:hypothetical protein Tco_0794835 [Tanacetum coccineum]
MLGPGRYSQWHFRFSTSANPLALLAAAQPCSDNYYQEPKPQRSSAPSYMQSSSKRPSASTRHKGKEIAKPVTLLNLSPFLRKTNKTEDTKPRYNNDYQSRHFGIKKDIHIAGPRESVGIPVCKRLDTVLYCRDLDTMPGNAGRPKRTRMKEIDEQELEAHYSYMAKIQEVSPAESSSTDTPLEQVDQNASECVDERVALANLIANLTLDTEENKMIIKQLNKRVIHSTSVADHQLKSYKRKQKRSCQTLVKVKYTTKKEVEDQHRISVFLRKTKSGTACNDSSNSRTSNVNAVCAECGKCVFNSNHDACVSRYLKDVNARAKKPNA